MRIPVALALLGLYCTGRPPMTQKSPWPWRSVVWRARELCGQVARCAREFCDDLRKGTHSILLAGSNSMAWWVGGRSPRGAFRERGSICGIIVEAINLLPFFLPFLGVVEMQVGNDVSDGQPYEVLPRQSCRRRHAASWARAVGVQTAAKASRMKFSSFHQQYHRRNVQR